MSIRRAQRCIVIGLIFVFGLAILAGTASATDPRIGTLHIESDLLMGATGLYLADVQGSECDLLAVNGTVTIQDGARLGLTWLPGADAASKFGGTYTLVTYLSHTGQFTFDEANSNIGAAYIQGIDYGSTAMDLTLYGLLDGDANADAIVDVLDYVVVSNNFGVGDNWLNGDVNQDGTVDVLDYVVISNNFGSTPGPGAIAGVSGSSLTVVPEPGTLVLLLCGGLGLLALCRRLRRR
jgi:hypothetical protein